MKMKRGYAPIVAESLTIAGIARRNLAPCGKAQPFHTSLRQSRKKAVTLNMGTAMNLLETYLQELRTIKASGAATKETSFYPALLNLLNTVGKDKALQPHVRCVLTPKSKGAGIPDLGLFTARQLQKVKDEAQLLNLPPERGVLEVKGTSAEVAQIAQTEQVAKYLRQYGQVLVTNYRDFLLLGRDAAGQAVTLESFHLAESEAAFWQAPVETISQAKSERFVEYLKRVMLHNAPLDKPADVAWFLASYARDAKARIEDAGLGALKVIRDALEEALGVKFEGEKGERFFRSTLVQTLFYGVFSAWVLWHKENPRKKEFDWRLSAHFLRIPILRKLFHMISEPGQLEDLRLAEPLDWASAVLNRVNRAVFFANFKEGEAVQYFYEPFLEAFDPQLRKELGVWYTPTEIVQYMVARVDTVLRTELGIADGLADERVYVLDPCCGTGAYLVAVLKRIHQTLRERNDDALTTQDLKRAATERVFGFEILPAPFVVAHLQLGLLLQSFDAPLAARQRAQVYLTNALTGWEPPQEPKKQLLFAEMEAERDAAETIKREKPILVVLGNPPYNAFAGVSPEEEQGLVEPYKAGLISAWGIKKFNLDDLYVRFFRLAERRIAEQSGKGVVCFISNYSWVSEPSFVVLRQRLLQSFDRFWIENMHGNRKISEYAPDGRTSETVFAIPGFSSGIQQGVVISLWTKTGEKQKKPTVLFRDDLQAARATERRQQLLDSLQAKKFDKQYQSAKPRPDNRFSFRPMTVERSYQRWPKLTELCAVAPSNGLMEKRGGALISIDRDALAARLQHYFDPKLDWEAYRWLHKELTEPQARFEPQAARKKALSLESYEATRLVRYAVRPFDARWCYYTGVRPVWNEPRPSLWAQCWSGNRFLMTRPAGVAAPEGSPFFFTRALGDNDFLRGHAYYFPLQLKNGHRLEKRDEATLFDILGEKPEEDAPVANLSAPARAYFATLNFAEPDTDSALAELLWLHALAIGYSPAYLQENADGIKQDWPRVPLPATRAALLASAELGRQIAALLDTETPAPNFTGNALRAIADITRAGGGKLHPEDGDLDVTAHWGYGGKEGVTMPGKGKLVERDYTTEEKASLGETAALLGATTNDVYLNAVAYWRNVPARVWDYTIGGYQVMKKWLSYRERPLLGRGLKPEEAREATQMARRIAAIVLLEPQLDANYQAIKADAYDWH
jgi:hypothetical protein